MSKQDFFAELNARIELFDLLRHPFYTAWSCGELTADEIADYAANYYAHVAAFPTYLKKLEERTHNKVLRRVLRRHREEEERHVDMWLDFAEGMGADRRSVTNSVACLPMQVLVDSFLDFATHATAAEALAFFYAYESQVPRIAAEKLKGLKQFYNADGKTCAYFVLHKTADIKHAQVWRDLIQVELRLKPHLLSAVVAAAAAAAGHLWQALDGIEARRRNRRSQLTLSGALR